MNLNERINQLVTWSLEATTLTDKDYYNGKIRGLIQIDHLIKKYAVDGKVKVVESGRDCDCVEYDGRVHIIDATLEAFEALDESIGEWEDGPYHLGIVPFHADVEYSSRDLVMEAREDGHPHSIVSRFP